MTGNELKNLGNNEEIKVSETDVPEIKIKLDKERYLRYDLNALCDLEDRFGSLDKAMDALMGETEKDDKGNQIKEIAKDMHGQIIKVNGNPLMIPKTKGFKVSNVRFLLYVGLKDSSPELTERDVGRLVGLNNIGYVASMIGKAMSDSMPEINKNEAPKVTQEKK